MREDFWPFVSACAVVVCSSLLVGMYAVKRTWFTDQKVNLETLYFVSNNFWPKVDYGTYEAAGMADMEMVRQPTQVRLAAVVVEQYPDSTNEVLEFSEGRLENFLISCILVEVRNSVQYFT